MLRHTNEGRTLLELAVERGLVDADLAAAAAAEIGEQDPGDRLVQLGLVGGEQLEVLRGLFQQELRSRSSFRAGARVGSRALPRAGPVAPPAETPSTCERIGHFHLRGELGRGAMGVVHRARDERRGIDVALKLLPPDVAGDPLRRRRLLEEARKAAMMERSPHVVTVFEAGVIDDRAYLAMELVEGKTLESWLLEPGGEDATADLLLQLVDGIAAAHAVGLVHRDIKPSNLMVTSTGLLKILDFGLAKDLVGPRLADSVDAVVGTPVYMAPELLQMALGLVPMDEAAAMSARIDVYAVGVTTCEAFGHGRPFSPVRSYGELLEQKIAVGAIIRRALGKRPPSPWRWVVPQMLAFDPGQRPADGVALQRLLREAPAGDAGIPNARLRLGGFAAGATAFALAASGLFGLLPASPGLVAAVVSLAGAAAVLVLRRPRPGRPAPRRVPRGFGSGSPPIQAPPVGAPAPGAGMSRARPGAAEGAPAPDRESAVPARSVHDADSGADSLSMSLPVRRVAGIDFREEYWVGPFCLKICVGDLTRLGAEGWVSPDDSLLTMGGGVSAAIAARLGVAHRRSAAALAPASAGTVVVTDTAASPVRHVLHAITIGVDGAGRPIPPTVAAIADCVAGVFQQARRLRLRSLAIPSLGTGAGGLPPVEVAKIICGRAIEHLADRANTTLQTIVFVASRGDDPLLAAIRSRLLEAAPRDMVLRRGDGPAWTQGAAADAFVSVD